MVGDKRTIFGGSLGRRHFLGSLGAMGLMLTPATGSGDPPPEENLESVQAMFKRTAPVIWLLTGDSITHGALHTMGWRSYPELFAERVRWELRRVRDMVINTGVSGDTTGGLLKDIDWRIFQFHPDVTSIMMGMNDCVHGPNGRSVFRSNLFKLLDATQEHKTLPFLHTPNLIYYHNAESRRDLPAYVEIIREVAQRRRIVLVDHYAHWQEATNPEQKNRHHEGLIYWLSDGAIHPNQYGHRELANLMFKKLGIYDPESLTCRLFIP